MVKEWGMSEKVGFRTIEQNNGSLVVVNDLSPQTAELIDSEIKRILQVIVCNFKWKVAFNYILFCAYRNPMIEPKLFLKNTSMNIKCWRKLY